MRQQVHFSDMKCALMLTSSFTCSKSSLWISFHVIGSVHISCLTSYEASFSEIVNSESCNFHHEITSKSIWTEWSWNYLYQGEWDKLTTVCNIQPNTKSKKVSIRNISGKRKVFF